MIDKQQSVLVTGATGYVGGRLVPALLESGYRVRVLVRDAARLEGRSWLHRVEVSVGDVFKPETLEAALRNVDVAYYMIHSMMDSKDFHQRDVIAARNFGEAAREADLKRIIYLGGLGEPEADLSQHLRSRQQTGEVLRESGVPVTEFRAAIIVGSGSISFEMIRYLTERLPVMICPQWVYTKVQPIGINDVLAYLVKAIDHPESAGKIIEIGGKEVLTYGEMMTEYANVRGLKRRLIPVPVLTPRLSSHWVNWITPIPSKIAQPLIEGLRNEVITHDNLAQELFPRIKPVSYRQAVKSALNHLQAGYIESSWSDSLSSSQHDNRSVVLTTREGMIVERRQRKVQAPPEAIYRQFSTLGGDRGWLYMNWAWRLRGTIDLIFGGVGLRRGRRHPIEVRVGDALDFWRVEAAEYPAYIRLRAEMKVPGDAWLLFEVSPDDQDSACLTQTAYFAPKGLAGFLYWYLLYPIHSLIFSGMINALAKNVQKGMDGDYQPTFSVIEPARIAIPVYSENKQNQ
ncbi:MAG: SDR family oxidoreductase [Anaerolineales bacterium]